MKTPTPRSSRWASPSSVSTPIHPRLPSCHEPPLTTKGICQGLQQIAWRLSASNVIAGEKREFGKATITPQRHNTPADRLFDGVEGDVWYAEPPPPFSIVLTLRIVSCECADATEQDEPRRQAERAPHGLPHRRHHPQLPLRRHRPREGPHLRHPVPPGGHVRLPSPTPPHPQAP